MFRPGHSVTGNMIVYAIGELLRTKPKKGKVLITEPAVKDRINELLQDIGGTAMETGAATHPEQELANAHALVLFPAFMPLGSSEEALSKARALIFASETSGKDGGEGKPKGKKKADADQAAEKE